MRSAGTFEGCLPKLPFTTVKTAEPGSRGARTQPLGRPPRLQQQQQKKGRSRGTHGGVWGVLTWISANELWPRALLGGRGVGGANQFVLGHLGVGLGKLQPQGLRDLRIKAHPLRKHTRS